ncbi:MAG: hypothetical protein V4682_00640 [Patescibacteria group bacterium]
MGYEFDGNMVTKGERQVAFFHEIRSFDDGQVSGVVGERGALCYWITERQLGLHQDDQSGFHDIYFDRTLGFLVGKIGSAVYQIDPETGFKVGKRL